MSHLDKMDLGEGVYAIRTTRYGVEPTPERPYCGLVVGHLHPNGEVCEGSVLFDVPENAKAKDSGRPVWTVESWDPLTISPSVHDPSCGLHGWIRDGRWVPA